jgi:hypothetical protein
MPSKITRITSTNATICGEVASSHYVQVYAAAAGFRSAPCIAGASAIKATPTMTSAADPIKNPTRWLALSNPTIDMTIA